jgi:Nucleotidyltransferase domain
LTAIQLHILKTLAYFDIFHYPLTNEEIKNFCAISCSQVCIDEQLVLLTANESIYKVDEFYSLHDNLFLAVRRHNGNKKAKEEMAKAFKASAVLYKFPFVEGLALSGSLSKNYADENSDIDFFIITKANRLWIARTLMHVFYKFAVMAGRQRLFCMNYYVDENGFEIEEKNIFTAMEIVTLVPVQGTGTVHNFINTNKWVKEYFPAKEPGEENAAEIKRAWLRVLVEKILSGSIGNAMDNWLMKLTSKHWKKKDDKKNVNNKGICMGMLADKHFSKPDPRHFQFKILEQYDSKIDEVVQKQNKHLLAVK